MENKLSESPEKVSKTNTETLTEKTKAEIKEVLTDKQIEVVKKLISNAVF